MGKRLSHEEFERRTRERYGDEFVFVTKYTKGHEKVRVIHTKCGREQLVDPWNLLANGSCPFCSNKWKRTTEDFRSEVLALSGGEYEVVGAYKTTNTDLLMRHVTCGHEFMRKPREFKQGKLCPRCRRPNYNTTTESFKCRLAEKYGTRYDLLGEYTTARTKVAFRCNSCGTVWECTPDSIMRNHGCPKCNISVGENLVTDWLMQNAVPFTPQYSTYECRDKRALRFDFAIFDEEGRVQQLVEYNGAHHYRPTRFSSKSTNAECEEAFERTKHHDEIKERFCAENGIPLLRISHRKLSNLTQILEDNIKLIPCQAVAGRKV